MADEADKFARFKSSGLNKPSFFDTYRQKSSDAILRRHIEDLLGPIPDEAFAAIPDTARHNVETAVNSYLDNPTSSLGCSSDIDALPQEEKEDADTYKWDRRLIGSIQADVWCTRSGRNLVEFGDKLKVSRTATSPALAKRDDFIIRFYNKHNLDFARPREEDAKFMAILTVSKVCSFEATVIWADPLLKLGSTVTVQLDCYLEKSAFSKTNSFGMGRTTKSKRTIVDESKESDEERLVRLRQTALVDLFRRLKITEPEDKPAPIAAVFSVSSTSAPTSSGDAGGTNEDDEELNEDQLAMFYKNAIPKTNTASEEADPSSSFALTLFPYQKRGLAWMLQRERVLGASELATSETHPLWTKLKWPEGDEFWANLNSGELSLARPTLAMRCRGGILADEMGLGKTISMLALLHSAEGESRARCTLLVAPLSLLSQWESEVKKAAVSVDACGSFVYYGATANNKSALKQFVYNANFEHKIVLTTYQTVISDYKVHNSDGNSDDSNLYNIYFDRVILDEAHMIKNRNTQTAKSCFDLKAHRRWALTGTPVVNRLEDMYSLIRFIGLDPWDNFAFWCAFVTEKFKRPESREAAMRTVQAIVSPICLRRTKAMKDPVYGLPLVVLPDKKVSIKRVEFNEDERALYSHLYARIRQSVRNKMKQVNFTAKYTSLLVLLLRLRQVCCHPLLLRSALGDTDEEELHQSSTGACEELPAKRFKLDPATTASADDDLNLDLDGDLSSLMAVFSETLSIKYTSDTLKAILEDPLENRECVICSEDHHTEPVLTECLHAACRDCLMSHIEHLKKRGDKPVCHICRAGISANRLFVVNYYSKRLQPLNNNMQSSKIRALIQALQEAPSQGKGKAVVFSEFSSFLDFIEANLRDAGFPVFRFDGSMIQAKRSESVAGFKAAKEKNAVLLLTKKAGGVGLNLVVADHAYIMDPWWNYASESQAIDRIHRMGQTEDVHVTRFIINGSIEEQILKIQERKHALSTLVTNEEKPDENMKNIRILFKLDETGDIAEE